MMARRKIYMLIVNERGIEVVERQHMLENILCRLNMIYEYADELDDLAHEINHKLDKLMEKTEKKNQNPSSDNDSPVQF